MSSPRLLPPVLALLALCCSQVNAGEAAEIVLKNGVIYTLDPARPQAKAVSLAGGRILGIGDEPGEGWIGPSTRVIDLKGACVVPGLWDSHGHINSLGLSRMVVNLVGTRSYAEVIERVKARAKDTPKGEWILGRGWDQNDWEGGDAFPTHEALSAAVPNHPVLLHRIGGHALLANALAMQLSNLTAGSTAPEGGEIVRDEDGQPSGVVVDAPGLIDVPDFTAAQIEEAVRTGVRECLSVGLVGVHEAGVGLGQIAIYKKLYEAKALPFRVYVMLRPGEATRRYYAKGPEVGLYDGRLTIRAVKHFMDGALGSRGAYLLEPYSDRPEARGLAQMETDALVSATRDAVKAGFQVCTHGIGDGGVRRILDTYEVVSKETPGDHRLRIEHAQVISPPDFVRFATLKVLPSMQPTHATSDMPWAEARLGPERARGAYAWKRLLDAGVTHLPLGSDFPVESANPLWGLYASVTRSTHDGQSPHGKGGWFPDQLLDRERALLGFTRDACYAAFMEEQGGRIAPGRWGDLSVFDRDVLSCTPQDLLKAKALFTFVNGEVAYEAK